MDQLQINEINDRLITSIRNQREKFSYYIIALCVTCIGFTIFRTSALPIRWTQLFYLFAVISWGLSTNSGFSFIKREIDNLAANFQIRLLHNRLKDVDDKNALRQTIAARTDLADQNTLKSFKSFRLQLYYFYFGVFCFIISHILEMWLFPKVGLVIG